MTMSFHPLKAQKRLVNIDAIGITLPGLTSTYLFCHPIHTPNPFDSFAMSVLQCNVRRHHIEKHQTFRSNFPEGSQERAVMMQCLLASYNWSCATMMWTCTAQERATAGNEL